MAAGGIGTAIAGVSAGARRIRFKRAVFHPVVYVVILNTVSLSAESLTLIRSQRARAINKIAAAGKTGKLINRAGLEMVRLVGKAGWCHDVERHGTVQESTH